MSTVRINSQRIEALTLIALLASIFTVYLLVLGRPMFRLDDSYIVLHNADALFSPDKNFPGTPALYGSTSLLHTLAAAFMGILLGPELGLMALSWIAIAFFGIAILELARETGLPLQLRILVTATALTTGDLVQVHLNGLETVLAMAAVSWMLVLNKRGSTAQPLLAAVAPFIRPELYLLSGLIMASLFLDKRNAGDIALKLRSAARFFGLLCTLLLVQFWTSGSFLPITGDAKMFFLSAGTASTVMKSVFGLLRTFNFVFMMFPLSLFLIALIRREYLIYTAFILALSSYFIFFQPDIIPTNFYRYSYILIPFFLLGGMDMIQSQRGVVRIFAICIFIFSLALNVYRSTNEIPRNIQVVKEKYHTLSETATWIKRNVDPSDTILVHDVGFISFATDQRLFDIVGLKSPIAVELNRRYTYAGGVLGRGKATAEMARITGAQVFLVSTGFNRNSFLTRPLTALGWTLTPHPEGNPPGHEAYLIKPPET